MNIDQETIAKVQPYNERQLHNVGLTLGYAKHGVATFPTLNKHPKVKSWPDLDTEIPEEEKKRIKAEARAEGKPEPIHIGCTRSEAVVKKLWRNFRDATPSIACGANGIIAIDVDVKRNADGSMKRNRKGEELNGPKLFAAYCEANGIEIPRGAPKVRSQSGEGYHLIFANPLKLSNSPGSFAELGCDIRGHRGQIVAPGSWRPDGKRYECDPDHTPFLKAFVDGTIPPLPEAFVKLIGTKPEGKDVSEKETAALAAVLRSEELPDAEVLLDPALDGLDLEALADYYPLLRELLDNLDGVETRSDDRFHLAEILRAERPDMTAVEFFAIAQHFPFCGVFVGDETPAQGEYNYRNVARDYLRAAPYSDCAPSTGKAFGAPVDESEDDEADVSPEVQADWEAKALKREDKAVRLKAEREEAAAQANSGKPPKPPTPEAWYENAAFIPVDLDINKLPPRPYLYGTYLLRGHVTLLSASGGVGKSAWFLSAAIDMACGVDNLNAGEFRPRKGIVYNAEDDLTEMYRRAGAYMLHHKFTDEMKRHVRENLTLISGVSGPMKLADYRDGRVIINKNAIALLKQMIGERGAEVLGLDPLVGLHTIPENANSEMNDLIMAIKGVTGTCDIATLLAHHDKKNIGNRDVGDASQDDARGAGTITTPMRVILSMKRLSKSDIKRLNIPPEDVPNVFSLSKGAKSNYSARDNGSRLFELTSVHATNGNEEHGPDSTVALRPYKLRASGPQISDDERDTILAEIAKGEFRSDPQANGPLVEFVSQLVGVDCGDADWRKQVNGLLVEWLSAGWIIKEKAKVKGHKREVPVYKLGPEKPPPAVVVFEAVEDEDE